MTIRVRVPGSLMLMGEHAVLHGELALVLATNTYIEVTLNARSDRQVFIDSALAQYQSSLDELVADPKLSFVLAAINLHHAQLRCGFDLHIQSEFSHTVGLGSSAAVTAGVVAALSRLCNETLNAEQLFDRSLAAVHQVQGGRGSGSDLVASIYGGIVAYRVAPREIRRLDKAAILNMPPVDLFYVGYKRATPEVIAIVDQLSTQAPELFKQLYLLMGQTAEVAEQAILSQDWALLGQLMNSYAGLLDALGVCDIKLADLQYRLRQSQTVLGAKISGSGLGDSVIALGQVAPETIDYLNIPVAVSPQGLEIVGDAHE